MAVILSNARNRLLAKLNASTVFGTADDSERFDPTEIDKALLAADGEVVAAILANPSHGWRPQFATGSTAITTSPSLLPGMVGPPESVQCTITGGTYAGVVMADPLPYPTGLQRIRWDNLNPNSNALIPPRYCYEGSTVWHNRAALLAGGASAVVMTVKYCQYTLGAALQSPDEYEDTVVIIAHGNIRDKEGEHAENAMMSQRLGSEHLASIRGGAMASPQAA